MRVAFLGLVLSQRERRKLAAELKGILPGSPEEQSRFIDAAEEAVDGYRKLYAPAAADGELRQTRLTRLSSFARGFAAAVAGIDEDSRDLLEQAQWGVLGKPSNAPDWDRTAAAANWAEVTADAADRLIAKMRQRRRSPSPAVGSLVADIAWAYGTIFGERPSPARNGIFWRAHDAVFRACRVDVDIGETRMRSLIRSRFLPGNPPKRGRKRRISLN